MAYGRGKPQPKGWHPQVATKHYKAYLDGVDKLATRTEAERLRREREERARTEYAKHAKDKKGEGK